MLRPYHLNATAFLGMIEHPMVEIFSDRPHKGLPHLLAKKGLRVRDQMWWEWSDKADHSGRRYGTGPADVQVRFHTNYHIEGCIHCPHAEPHLAAMEIYRIIDEINARWFP